MTNDQPTAQGQEQAQLELRLIEQRNRVNLAEQEKDGVRHPVTKRFISHSLYGASDQLIVQFTKESVFSPYQTAVIDDGDVHYVEQDFVTVLVPGDTKHSVHRPVTEMDKWLYPLEWEKYRAGINQAVQGTPIDELELSGNQIKMLKYHNVTSVEQLSEMSETLGASIPNFTSIKRKARQFLDGSTSRDHEIGELKSRLDQLTKLLELQHAAPESEEAGDAEEPTEEAKPKMRFGKPIKQ